MTQTKPYQSRERGVRGQKYSGLAILGGSTRTNVEFNKNQIKSQQLEAVVFLGQQENRYKTGDEDVFLVFITIETNRSKFCKDLFLFGLWRRTLSQRGPSYFLARDTKFLPKALNPFKVLL